MPTIVYPTNYEITEILPDLIADAGLDNDPIFQHFPIDYTEMSRVIWEKQDNFVGLTQLRGINGQPGRVLNVGEKTYEMDPGYYGDSATITEKEMLQQRKPGTPNEIWDVSSLVMKRTRQLLQRAFWRIRQVVWALAATGTFSVVSPDGVLKHTDKFTVQTGNAAVSWGTYASATPYADFGTVQLAHRGYSVKFDSTATAYMNQTTFNKMLKNTNSADLAGFKGQFGQSVISSGLAGVNQILANNDRPNIVVWDEVYLNESGTAVTFIPDDVVVIIGKRPGNQPAGKTVFTKNAAVQAIEESAGAEMEQTMKGLACKVIDRTPQMVTGAEIELGVSFNFGPTVEYGSSIYILNVA